MEDVKVKKDILETLKRLVPGAIDITGCDYIEQCVNNNMRSCDDIKNLCISCRNNDRVIGGISFIYDIAGVIGGKGRKNGIVLYRYGQEGYYAKMFEGNGINEIMEKVEKDEVIKDITEKTKFVRDEQKDAEDLKKIDAFKRYIDQSSGDSVCILVTRKNSDGEYEDIDKKLIEIAKEKEEKTGKKIKIIDESEVDKNIYVLGIESRDLIKKLEFEVDKINDADNRIHIFVLPVKKNEHQSKYAGILAIHSTEDDILGVSDEKDRWRTYFIEKYKKLSFIGNEIFKDGDKATRCNNI